MDVEFPNVYGAPSKHLTSVDEILQIDIPETALLNIQLEGILIVGHVVKRNGASLKYVFITLNIYYFFSKYKNLYIFTFYKKCTYSRERSC